MLLQAEQLPPEIWLNIFTYFEGHDLVRMFSRLNSFFDSLLRSPHLQLYLRMKQGESNERLPEWIWSQIDREYIYSLGVGRRKANCLIQFLRWNAPYLTRLSSLSVYLRGSQSYYNIQFLLFALAQMPSLNFLRIKYLSKFHLNTDPLGPLFAAICSSRFAIRNYSIISDMTDYRMETSTWTVNPFMQHLYIQDIAFNNLLSFLSLTPELQSLQAGINVSNDILYENFCLTHLRKVNLRLHRPHFNQLQRIKEVAPNLQSLQLEGSFDWKDENYFKENLWRKLLDNITYFYVNLETVEYSETHKIALKNYIQNLSKESWFSWVETELNLRVSIKFRSVQK